MTLFNDFRPIGTRDEKHERNATLGFSTGLALARVGGVNNQTHVARGSSIRDIAARKYIYRSSESVPRIGRITDRVSRY